MKTKNKQIDGTRDSAGFGAGSDEIAAMGEETHSAQEGRRDKKNVECGDAEFEE